MDYLLHLFVKGGPVMYPLLLCSLCAVAIAVERFFYYRRQWHPKDGFTLRLHSALDEQNWDSAVEICQGFDTVISRTAQAGLVHAGNSRIGSDAVKDAFMEHMNMEVTGLRRHLDYLSAIVTCAPLLGLLGTVTGMIGTFGAMEAEGGAAAVSGGIGEALVATATGLCVALIAFAIYTYFDHQMYKVVYDTEKVCYFVLEHKRGEAA